MARIKINRKTSDFGIERIFCGNERKNKARVIRTNQIRNWERDEEIFFFFLNRVWFCLWCMFTIEIPFEDRRIKKLFTNQLGILQNFVIHTSLNRTDHRYTPKHCTNIQQILYVNSQSDAIPLIAYIKGCIYEPLS